VKQLETQVLIERARTGEQEAFGALLHRYAPRLLTVIGVRIAGSLRAQLESTDVLQDVMVTAIRRFRDFRGTTGGELIAWLTMIAKTRVVDMARHHARDKRDAGLQAPLDDAGDVQAKMASALTAVILDEQTAAERARLEMALRALEPDQRDVIIWHTLEDATYKEIATRMNRSEEACRKLHVRGMVALTKQLQQQPA
jgi:RNA polymerase sigma-70 factor (ECF subfamily)